MADDAFDAFISYNHAADGRLADALRNGLQAFAKPWNRRRAMRVFLDRSSLELTSSLGDALEAKLAGAGHLILLASEASASSRWCDQETAYWIAERQHDTLLLVLTDPDAALVWDDDAERFDPDRSTALPPSLHDAFPEEPLWLDMRWVAEQDDDARLDLRSAQFRDAVATLSSSIQGIPKDQLDGEDVRQHRRFTIIRRVAVSLLVALTVTAVVAGITAVRNADEAARQEAISDARRAGASVDVDMRAALADAADVYRNQDDPETERVMVELASTTTRLDWSRDLDGELVDVVAVADLAVWGAADGGVGLIRPDGEVVRLTTGATPVDRLAVDADGQLVEVRWEDGATALVDPVNGDLREGASLDEASRRGMGMMDLSFFGNRGFPEDDTATVVLDLNDRTTSGKVISSSLVAAVFDDAEPEPSDDVGAGRDTLPFFREQVFFNAARLSGDARTIVVLQGAMMEVWQVPENDGRGFRGSAVRRLFGIEGVDPAATGLAVNQDGSTSLTWSTNTIQSWTTSVTNDVVIAPERSPGGAADAVIVARMQGDVVEWADGWFEPPRRLDLATSEQTAVTGPDGDQLELELSDIAGLPGPATSEDGRLEAAFSNGSVVVRDVRDDRIVARFPSDSDGMLFFDTDATWVVMAMRGGGLQVWPLDVALRCEEIDLRIARPDVQSVC